MEDWTDDIGPADPNLRLTLDLGDAERKPLSQSNRVQPAANAKGNLILTCSRHIQPAKCSGGIANDHCCHLQVFLTSLG